MNHEIKEILTALKKRCSKIIFKEAYQYSKKTDSQLMSTSNYLNDEGWIVDAEGRDLMFQIINFDALPLDNDIQKLQYFYNCNSDSVEVFDKVETYVEAEKMTCLNGVLFFEEDYNLPDCETLKIMHEEVYQKLLTLFEQDGTEGDFDDKYEAYSQAVLGHEGFHSFVGGNLNQVYWLYLDKEFYKNYEFVLQIETDFYTFVHIFRHKENKKDFKSFMGRS